MRAPKSTLRPVPSPHFLPGRRSRLASPKTAPAGNSENPRELLVDTTGPNRSTAPGRGQTLAWPLDLAAGRRNFNRSVAPVPNAPSDYEISRLFERFLRSSSRATSRKLPVAEHCCAPRSADAEPTSACGGSDSGDGAEVSVSACGVSHGSQESHESPESRHTPNRSFPLDSSGVAQRVLPTYYAHFNSALSPTGRGRSLRPLRRGFCSGDIDAGYRAAWARI